MGRPRVVFLQAYIYQYRVPFYEALRRLLDARGIDLELVHGDPSGKAAHSADHVRVAWADHIDNVPFTVFGKELWWQPALTRLRGVDLVVVEQASSRLVNYVLLAWQILGGPKLAYWGHGKDWRPDHLAGLGEGLKRFTSRRVHWWFAYNPAVVEIVAGLGFPRERITDTKNAIDTLAAAEACQSLSPDDVAAVRQEMGVPDGAAVVLYCGSMYPDKRLEYIVAAMDHLRSTVKDAHLVFVGDGRSSDVARRAAAEHDDIHFVGQRFDDDRAPYFAMSRLLLLPGAVGLAVLDAFAAGLPVVTSISGDHGPELAYLEDGTNALVVDDHSDPRVYGDAVARLLNDDDLHQHLAEGARQSAEKLTVEGMASRFADGIESALGRRRSKPSDGPG